MPRSERRARFLHLCHPIAEAGTLNGSGSMAARRTQETEQRMIDTEVRRSVAREADEAFTAARDAHQERESSRADRRWYRGELIAMLTAAKTASDLHELGLSDDVVREARLGDTLVQAWARFRPPHFAARTPDGTAERAHPAPAPPVSQPRA